MGLNFCNPLTLLTLRWTHQEASSDGITCQAIRALLGRTRRMPVTRHDTLRIGVTSRSMSDLRQR